MSWWGGKKPEKKKGAGADDFEKTDQTPGYDGEDVNLRVDVRASFAWHTPPIVTCTRAPADQLDAFDISGGFGSDGAPSPVAQPDGNAVAQADPGYADPGSLPHPHTHPLARARTEPHAHKGVGSTNHRQPID